MNLLSVAPNSGASASKANESVRMISLPKVKIGLVGLNFGFHIIDEIQRKPACDLFEIAALCDQDIGRLNAAAAKADVTRYEHLEDLLADPEIEAVGLFTHPAGRIKLMRQILRSGRDIITTKPLGLDPDGMLELLSEARRLGRSVHCNSPGPLRSSELAVIESWMQKYDLGCPVGARADVWTSYREAQDGTWYDDPKMCPAAPIYRLGIYLINDLVRLWGRVQKVQVMHSRFFTGRPTTDNAQVALLFENRAVANIYASFCVNDGDHYRNSLVLNFENGTIYRNAGPAWTLAPGVRSRLALVQSCTMGPSVVAEAFEPIQSGDYQWEYFAEAVRGSRVVEELTPDQMVEGIRIMKAISEAERGEGAAVVSR
ncbi:hypothetical protein BH09VER1_BH09VER1_47080 [soil metagenome]